MDEPEVVLLVRKYFEVQGFKLKGQPIEGDVVLNGGEIRVDIQAFRETKPPDLIWNIQRHLTIPLAMYRQ